MQCQELEQAEFNTARSHLAQTPRYILGDKGRALIQFQFNLNPMLIGESLFVIFSQRAQAAVYLGPYQSSVSVNIDETLSSDKGYDQLEFRLLQLTERKLCSWLNERGEPYWQPGARIDIAFLRSQTFDEAGLPKCFDVTIR